ncbi:unnamed protein product [Arabidopsis lyrata]|uniref:Predicted protein n=1 Tax=Arabidopsis lyrata subsp. lyrata TaxID=81972 RepID=D7KID1_ARALL|nr:uncharacterized protein LOC9327075 isoform X2 [Arabidopsis lyrata subsp. lyrata]EFH67272.1 predicted protein [Arabidopsis lyrata subsp. lyrata]CAH8254297.1 unnamed protein product [Arabidopsis lyrata]|eukprot:XP_002891013.1 uncharacterized protein LOC9327075 isoform X2 [Arabidopsis lyrata subsp. lyrata]
MRTKPVAEMKIGEDVQLAGDEALADVIAPVEVLEQFWKPADPKFRVSILVQRRIETLALNSGPDVEEAERLIGKPKPTGDVDPNCPFHILRRDLLRFDIVNYAVASLGFSPLISQQVSTLTWLKAWLNNDLTSVPKLAIYNQNSVVQGYDLLLPTGDSRVVQQNGPAVLRFLQSKCKGDPGVYWLYKSAEEDEIKLFDFSTTSKNHSSCASSLPLVLHACAREQLARLIMTNKKLFEPKTAEKESFLAVDHISQAIKFLTDMQKQLPSSEQEGDWLSTSIIDKKLWGLIMLLGESYLSLGEAYKEEEKLDQALRTIKEACSIYGSLPHSYDKTLFDSTLRDSISRPFDIPKFAKWVKEEEYSTEEVKDDTSLKQLSPKHLFWAKVWLLVGDIYAKFIIIPLSSEGSEVVTEKKVVKEEVRLHNEKVGNKLKNKLTTCRHECASCLLVNCLCPVDKGKGKGGKSKSKSKSKEEESKSKSKSKEEERGGIFKYLKESRKNDAETNLFTALHCYNQVQKALPSGCKLLISLHVRKAWVWHRISMEYYKIANFKECEDAMVKSAQACMDSGDYANLIGCYCSLGSLRQNLGSEKEEQMMKYKLKARKKTHLELATKEYIRSLQYYMEAKKGVSRALEKRRMLPETTRDDVQLKLAVTYLVLGRLLCVNFTTVDAPTELKSTSENTQGSLRLSADDAVKEASALLESLGKDKVAYAHDMLAAHHGSCYASILEANEQAGLAIKKWNDAANEQADLAFKNWNDAMECYGPEINHPDSVFVSIVTKRSALYFKSQRQSEFMIDLELRRFLVCHRIFEEDEKKIDGKDVQNFLQQLRNILKEMLLNGKSSKKLEDLYCKSQNATSLSSLKDMHDTWTS